MRIQGILFGLVVTVLLLWTGLSVLRRAGAGLMQEIEQSYREYYLTHEGDHGESPPLVRWNFEKNKLIEIPAGEVQEIEGTGGLRALVVKEPDEGLPLRAYGIILARIHGSWFHGVFAVVSILLAVFAFKMRSG